MPLPLFFFYAYKLYSQRVYFQIQLIDSTFYRFNLSINFKYIHMKYVLPRYKWDCLYLRWHPHNGYYCKALSRSRTLFGEGNGTPLQYSCLENPMDGGAWCATVHRAAKSQTRPKQPSMLAKLYLSTNWSSEESTYPTKRTSSCLHKAKVCW